MSVRSTDAGSKKAKIQVLARSGGVAESFRVQFNPTEYDVEKSVQYSEQEVPGYASPVTQFVNGQAGSLSMELFFDTYEKRDDVREETRKLESLLEIDDDRRAPPVLRVAWAELQFTCVLESANTSYTMFLPSGTPVRAHMRTVFKEYTTPTKQRRESSRDPSDQPKVHVVKEGDTLWEISGTEFGDPTKWRVIARENDVDDPRTLQPGTELTIPAPEDG